MLILKLFALSPALGLAFVRKGKAAYSFCLSQFCSIWAVW
jgi:hypothetical protein